MSKSIYIVGTVHVDVQGRNKLTSLLDTIKPDVISIELPEENNRMHRADNVMEAITSKLDDKYKIFVSRFIHAFSKLMGYEYYVTKDYAERNNIPIINADINGANLTELSENGLVNTLAYAIRIFVDGHLDYSDDENFNTAYNGLIDIIIHAGLQSLNTIPEPSERDTGMADKLMEISTIYNKCLHIGGLLHMTNIRNIMIDKCPNIICHNLFTNKVSM